MVTPRQLLLDIEHPHDQTLHNFVAGSNTELVTLLLDPPPGCAGVWIHGVNASGRSHLLRGACLAAEASARASCYLAAVELVDRPELLQRKLQDAHRCRVVAIDDVGALLGRRQWEEAIIGVYQHLQQVNGVLLVSHQVPAAHAQFCFADLASRLGSLQHFGVKALTDEEKATLLQSRARNRGYELTDAVLDYWLTRGPRDLGSLLADLDELDRVSLAQQRRVTIPLLKQALGY